MPMITVDVTDAVYKYILARAKPQGISAEQAVSDILEAIRRSESFMRRITGLPDEGVDDEI